MAQRRSKQNRKQMKQARELKLRDDFRVDAAVQALRKLEENNRHFLSVTH